VELVVRIIPLGVGLAQSVQCLGCGLEGQNLILSTARNFCLEHRVQTGSSLCAVRCSPVHEGAECEADHSASSSAMFPKLLHLRHTLMYQRHIHDGTPQNVASRKGGTKLYIAIKMYLRTNPSRISMQACGNKM
jgi:hypothetical protein